MIFPLTTILAGLSLLSFSHAVPTPTPDSIVLDTGGQDFTISSTGPISVVSSSAGPDSGPTTPDAKAIYFISNVLNNTVVALKVGANGKLSYGSSTPTGGSGMNGIDGTTNGTAAPDALFSQGAVKVAGNVS